MDISRFSEYSTTQVFNLKSMDRNADQEFQVTDDCVVKTVASMYSAGVVRRHNVQACNIDLCLDPPNLTPNSPARMKKYAPLPT